MLKCFPNDHLVIKINKYSGNDGMRGKWSNASKMKKNVFKIIKWFENDGMLWK